MVMVEFGIEARGSEVEAQLVNGEVNPVCKCEDKYALELLMLFFSCQEVMRKELSVLH